MGQKYQALHLLRRLHACHRGVPNAKGIGVGSGDASPPPNNNCQFSVEDTARLRDAVIRREMERDWGHINEGIAAECVGRFSGYIYIYIHSIECVYVYSMEYVYVYG